MTDVGATERIAAPEPDSLVGTKLAHFRIDELLGRGGMGEVYKASDLALDRPVAIKLISKTIAHDEKLRSRFFAEARSQARLQHPNVCHIYYIGEEGEHLFFAMEFIDGESLQQRLERHGQLTPEVAVELCRMAALGLREANKNGFTHRDIKPSNLMIDHNDVVKVVDFGLVKQTGDADGLSSTAAESIDATSIVGTPLYMSPEQAKGERVDFRSDVYSLGATLHHLVSGEPPFVGPTPLAVVSKHLSDPRPLIDAEKKRRRGPSPIDALCDRMMAKEAGDRFDSYDELVASMEQVSPSRTQSAGFWVRAFALCLDALAVLLMTLPLQPLVTSNSGVPFLTVALVYAVIAHGRWGQTLGKAALEIEVVSTKTHQPAGYYAAAMRYLAQWGLFYVAIGANLLVDVVWPGNRPLQIVSGIAVALAAVAIPVEGALASWMTPHKRTLWDRVSNTMVRYRRKS